MVASVDGRTWQSRQRPARDKSGNLFETLHDELKGDAWLVGRVTGREFAKKDYKLPAPGLGKVRAINLAGGAAFLIVLVPFMSVFLRHRPFESPMPGPATAIFMLWFWAVNLFGVWLYYALFESSSWQGTPGKRALGLFVTDMQGRRISFARATGRYFGRFISTAILFIGYLMIAFTERKQALHDMLADCLVLRRL